MSVQPLARSRTLVEQVRESLLEAICSGRLAPGERLIQDDLATRMQVSRQPVIAALGLLRQQGFVIEHGRRGLRVAPLDRDRIACIRQLRLALEPLAARLAAARASSVDPGVDAAHRLIARGREALRSGDHAAAVRADLEFHRWLCAASGNPLLEQSMQLHWSHLRRTAMTRERSDAPDESAWNEHAAIIEAIAGGAAEEAARRARAHLAPSATRVEQQCPSPVQ